MATIAGNYDHFNNLLYAVRRNAQSEMLEHKAGRVALDLRPKRPARPMEVLNATRAQINGKNGDLLYKTPFEQHSRPYYGYDAPYDPTILNSVKYKFTDVSGLLIAPIKLPKNKDYMDRTFQPLMPYGQVK